MRKSLRVSGLSVQDMADYLGVRRETVSTWLTGRIVPKLQTLRLWAMRTGVPFGWLASGEFPVGGPRDGESYTPRDSNPEPAVYWLAEVAA